VKKSTSLRLRQFERMKEGPKLMEIRFGSACASMGIGSWCTIGSTYWKSQ
jgi:hypothetical protein